MLPMNTGVEGGETAGKLARRWGYRVKVGLSAALPLCNTAHPLFTRCAKRRGAERERASLSEAVGTASRWYTPSAHARPCCRVAKPCNTVHPLYTGFMKRLSASLFETPMRPNLGLDRIVALYYPTSTLYHIH